MRLRYISTDKLIEKLNSGIFDWMNDDKRSQELKTEYTLRVNTERYPHLSVFSFECGKIQTRITPNTDTFHAVYVKRAETFSKSDASFVKTITFFENVRANLSHIFPRRA